MKAKPCEVCGNSYQYFQMEFDHLPEFTKKKPVASCTNLAELYEEIAKCRVLCAWCHRTHTAETRYRLHFDNSLIIKNPDALLIKRSKKKRFQAPVKDMLSINPGVASGARHGSQTKPERLARGEKSGHSKVTEEQVVCIRQLRSSGETAKSLAITFGVRVSAINGICSRSTWKHVA